MRLFFLEGIAELKERLEAMEKALKEKSDPLEMRPYFLEISKLRERLEVMEKASQADPFRMRLFFLEGIAELKERLEFMEEASQAEISDPLGMISYLLEITKLRERLEVMEEASQADPFRMRLFFLEGIAELKERLEAMEKALKDPLEMRPFLLKEITTLRELSEALEKAFEDPLEMRPFLLEEIAELKERLEAMEKPSQGRRFISSRRKRFCQVIINRQVLEALDEEKEEFESVFNDLGYYVAEKVCRSNDDVERVIDSVASSIYYRHSNLFVCFIQSVVTKDWEVERPNGRSLSVTELIAKFSFKEDFLLSEPPKIFIIEGHQTTTAEKAFEPLHEKPFSVKLPERGNYLCLFVPYRKGYISTLLSVIKLHGSKPTRRHILDILSEAKKLFYDKNHITIPDPVHNLVDPVYLNLEV